MPVLTINRICRELLRDRAFRLAMRNDPASALRKFDLTDEERRALLAGDVVALHRLGANDFLMGYLVRFEVCGVNAENFNRRMRTLTAEVNCP